MQFPSFPRLALLVLVAVAGGAAELTLTAPARSYLAPLCIEGTMPASLPRVTTYGFWNFPVKALGPQAWHSDVWVAPDWPTVVTVSAGGVQRAQTVVWASIDLDGAALALNARAGDVIALRLGGTRIEVLAPGGATGLLRTRPNAARLIQLLGPGDYRFRRPGDVGGVTVRVYAPTVRPDPKQPVAVLANRSRYDFPLPVAPTLDDLFCTSADPDLVVSRTGNGVAVTVRAPGTHIGAVRLGSPTGRILGTVPVIGYDLDISRALFPQPVAADGSVPQAGTMTVIGSMSEPQRLRARVVMKPWVPNVKMIFTKFAHPAYFLNGATTFSVLSDGSPTTLGEPGFVTSVAADGVRIGTLDYTIWNPAGNHSQCVRIDCRTLFSGLPAGIASLFHRAIKL